MSDEAARSADRPGAQQATPQDSAERGPEQCGFEQRGSDPQASAGAVSDGEAEVAGDLESSGRQQAEGRPVNDAAHVEGIDVARLLAADFLGHIDYLPETTSTNDVALRLAQQPRLPTPALVIAERQTAGRGRGAHRWWSAPGGLTFTLVLEPDADQMPSAVWPRVSLAVATALVDVVAPRMPAATCGVRWPNDVFVDERKLAGILVEVPAPAPSCRQRLAVGVGLNVNNSLAAAPDEVRRVGTSLADATGHTHDRTELLLALLSRLDHRLQQLVQGDRELPRRWQSLCLLAGREVQLDSGTRRVAGRCGGIGLDGGLVIEVAGRPQRFYGGTLTSVGPR